MVRQYGLTIDSLLGAELVTADGEVHVVDEDHEPDVFWAIRGGGGNFGVVVSFLYRVHPVSTVLGGTAITASAEEVKRGGTLTLARPDEALTFAGRAWAYRALDAEVSRWVAALETRRTGSVVDGIDHELVRRVATWEREETSSGTSGGSAGNLE